MELYEVGKCQTSLSNASGPGQDVLLPFQLGKTLFPPTSVETLLTRQRNHSLASVDVLSQQCGRMWGVKSTLRRQYKSGVPEIGGKPADDKHLQG